MTTHASGLDSLRGVLSLIVVAAHAWQIFIHPVDPPEPTLLGVLMSMSARLSVLAFFTLSGYVIALSIQANIARHGRFDAVDFAIARTMRIVPPLLVVIGLTFGLQVVLILLNADVVLLTAAARRGFRTDPGGQLLALATLCLRGELTGAWLNGPLWSLVFEIRFYVLAGLFALAVSTDRWSWRIAALVLIAGYAEAVGLLTALADRRLDLQGVALAAFASGALAFRWRALPVRVWITVAVGAFATGAWMLWRAEVPVTAALDEHPTVLASQILLALGFAALVVLVARGRPWRVFREAGSYSYTLYIGHFPLLLAGYFLAWTFARWLLTPTVAPLTALGAALLAWSVLAWLGRRIEHPQSQRRRIAQWVPPSTVQRAQRAVPALLVLCASFGLASSATPPRPMLQLFGDSTQVQAYGPLRERLGPLVQSQAVGESSSGMLVSGSDGLNPPWPGAVTGRLVLINHGMNDARPWSRVSLDAYRANLRRLAVAPSRVVFVTPNPSTYPGRDTHPYAEVMREVGAELGVAVVDVHACFQRQPDWPRRLPDQVHPDEQGVQFIVDHCLLPVLIPMLHAPVDTGSAGLRTRLRGGFSRDRVSA